MTNLPLNSDNDITKSWTIRKIDAETIEKTKRAAGKSGMKIGAWVDSRLREAANSTLSANQNNGLSEELNQIVEALDSNQSHSILERLTKIESDFVQIIKGQHSILLTLQEIRNERKVG